MLRLEGRVANHDGEFEAAIEIDEKTGLIEHVGRPAGKSDLDLSGQIIFPGFGDIHIHAREDASQSQVYKEDFATISAASIHGGVTHVADMPNNPIAPVDEERYAEKRNLTANSAVYVTLYAGIGPDTHPLKWHVPYKAFMGPSVGELFFSSQEQLEEVISRYRGRNVSFHCEDPEILEESRGAPTHEQRRPARAEITATEFALYLIEKYDLMGKLCHYSTKGGLQKIAAAKARGVKVTAEATPHHLFFDDSMLTDENRLWLQMNPPLRGPEDRLALIEALREGLVDYVATDHAPHTMEEKLRGVSGVPHLDTYGAFATWLMAEHGFSAAQIARVCAWNPGRFVNEFLPQSMENGYGVIAPGYVGSLTILNPDAPFVVERAAMKTKCGWSPFEGYRFPGRVTYTVLRGKVYPAD
ncbi:MAG: amidohydrolase family protein [Acidobacteriaceae bacterium]